MKGWRSSRRRSRARRAGGGVKHLITIADLTSDEAAGLVELAGKLKAKHAAGELERRCTGKVACLFFEKASLRTRLSFESAAAHVGASSIFIGPGSGRLGERETIADMARTSARYCDCLVLRTFSHEAIVEMAEHSSVPVINALSDKAHPCQALADMLTIKEKLGRLEGVKLAYVGDANNVAVSLAHAASRLGVHITVASPEGYGFDAEFVKEAGGSLRQTADAAEAVRDADVIYTDVWASMGQEAEREKRLRDFQGYQIDSKLVSAAPGGAIVMHCLPAHRGEEISDEVVESERSVVFDQAENRLHLARALFWELM